MWCGRSWDEVIFILIIVCWVYWSFHSQNGFSKYMSEYDQAAHPSGVRLERASHPESGARKRNPASRRETKSRLRPLIRGFVLLWPWSSSWMPQLFSCSWNTPAEIRLVRCTEQLHGAAPTAEAGGGAADCGSRETITGFDSRTVNQLLPPALSAGLFWEKSSTKKKKKIIITAADKKKIRLLSFTKTSDPHCSY